MTNLQKAIDIFNQGGVVIFPTDTVYGIGCRIDNPDAVKRVFDIRKRSETKPVLAVVNSIAMAQAYLQPIPLEVKQRIIEPYWPGQLTIILPCLIDKVPSLVRAGGSTLAVRQTDNPILLEILHTLHVPIIAPSANFAGENTPTTLSAIDPKLRSLVDYVIEEHCGGSQPSTIIDCAVMPWKIIRKGPVVISV